MGLPTLLPAGILDRILNNSEATYSEAAERNAIKISRRFGRNGVSCQHSDPEEEEKDEVPVHRPTIIPSKKFP
jgi:hypothetical protein